MPLQGIQNDFTKPGDGFHLERKFFRIENGQKWTQSTNSVFTEIHYNILRINKAVLLWWYGVRVYKKYICILLGKRWEVIILWHIDMPYSVHLRPKIFTTFVVKMT